MTSDDLEARVEAIRREIERLTKDLYAHLGDDHNKGAPDAYRITSSLERAVKELPHRRSGDKDHFAGVLDPPADQRTRRDAIEEEIHLAKEKLSPEARAVLEELLSGGAKMETTKEPAKPPRTMQIAKDRW